MIRALSAACVLAVLALPAPARAHGDEDHGPPRTAAPQAPARTAYLVTHDFEIVAKWPGVAPGRDLHVTLWIADPDTNRPIEGAAVALEVSGPEGRVAADVEPGGAPGTYVAHLTPRVAGTYGVVAQVSAGGRSDLLAAEGLVFGPDPSPAAVHPDHDHVPWPWIAVGAGLLAVLALLASFLDRRRAPPAAMALALALWPGLSRSHGGDDHAPPPRATGGEGFVAKEVQFLLGLETAPVARRPMRPTLETLGTVAARPDRHAMVAPPQAGIVSAPRDGRIPHVGDHVTKGQVLAHVDEIPAAVDRLALGEARIDAESARTKAAARAALARKRVARLRGLTETVARREVEEAEAEVALALAEEAEARRRLGLLQEGLPDARRFDVVAPLDGVIFESTAVAGARADPGTPLFEVVDIASVWIEARVFAHHAARAAAAEEAEVRFADVAEVFTARRVTAAGAVDPLTQTLAVRFEADNPGGVLRPGMIAEVTLGIGRKVARLAVPEAAVVDRAGVPGVYVKVDPEHFAFRAVRFGTREGTSREVVAGLAAGDLVVVQAAGTLD